ncbi:MAG: hypothetical protein NC177_12945 [Ruminococcus flavefaciens]|nr:hypothetical protein [Ruminococcus flavefaciens]
MDKAIERTRATLVYSIDGKVVERASVNVYQYHEPVKEQIAETVESTVSDEQ